jgi:hypothetical protein
VVSAGQGRRYRRIANARIRVWSMVAPARFLAVARRDTKLPEVSARPRQAAAEAPVAERARADPGPIAAVVTTTGGVCAA